MTRKDYIKAAAIIKHRWEMSEERGEGFLLLGLAQDFANWFADDNSRFDHKRFYAACGMDDWLGKAA